MPGSKLSYAPEKDSFSAPFMRLEGKREGKEGHQGWEKARRGGLITGQLRFCALLRVVMSKVY